MSFDINWDSISRDDSINRQLLVFLNDKLDSIELPEYLNGLQVVKFSLGDKSPEIVIKDIDAPFPEFYSRDDDDTGTPVKVVSSTHLPHPQQQQQQIHRPIPSSPMKHSIASRFPQTNSELSRSPSPVASVLSGLNRVSTPLQNSSSNTTNSNNNNSINNLLGSPIAPRTSLLMPRTNSSYLQGLSHGAAGIGIGGFGIKDSAQDYYELQSTPMNANLSIDGVYDVNGNADLSNGTTSNFKKSFQLEAQQEESNKENRSKDNDVQLTVDLKFDSSIYIEVICNLLVNYPAHEFIKLPVRLKITDLSIHSLAVLAYLDKRLFISFLCDINDDDRDREQEASRSLSINDNINDRLDSRTSSISEITATTISAISSNRERIDIIKNLKIEGELGNYEQQPIGNLTQLANNNNSNNNKNNSKNGSILRNIGKIEKFLVGAMRTMLINELAWPSWIELDFNENDDEAEGEGGEDCGNDDNPESNYNRNDDTITSNGDQHSHINS